MQEVTILQSTPVSHGWHVDVGVDGRKFTVKVSKDMWQKLSGGRVTPEQLVEAVFYFLQDKEPVESILAVFDLDVIPSYFPDFSETIGSYLDISNLSFDS